MFKVNEIKSWAKKYGITVKKHGNGYTWGRDGEEPSDPADIDSLVKEVFNIITQGRFLEHQKNYRSSELS